MLLDYTSIFFQARYINTRCLLFFLFSLASCLLFISSFFSSWLSLELMNLKSTNGRSMSVSAWLITMCGSFGSLSTHDAPLLLSSCPLTSALWGLSLPVVEEPFLLGLCGPENLGLQSKMHKINKDTGFHYFLNQLV